VRNAIIPRDTRLRSATVFWGQYTGRIFGRPSLSNTGCSGTFLVPLYDMKNKIAIPHHLGHVSPVFDVARNVLTVSVRDGQERGREEALLESVNPFLRAQELRNLGVDLLVCGAISRPYEMALLSKGIKLRHSICGPLEEVLSAALRGALGDARFAMPGFGGPRRFRRGYGGDGQQ
jgi:predicted Fe-Mo cluster-binding NifX family protein